MPLRVCYLTYWGESPATQTIRQALHRRNHELLVLSPLECSIHLLGGRPPLTPQPPLPQGERGSRTFSPPRFGEGPGEGLSLRGRPLEGIDVVLTRCVAYHHQGRLVPRHLEALVATTLTLHGATAINRPESKLLASDKMRALVQLAAHGLRVPATLFVASVEEAESALASLHYPVVIKLNEGLRGSGVMRVDSEVSFRSVAEGFLQLGQPLLIQPYLLTEQSQQLRVLVLADEILVSYETRARSGDFRANLHAGATPTPATLSRDIADVSIRAARILGLDFAGVDLIVNEGEAYVIEVNPAPGFEHARTVATKDIGEALVDHMEKAMRK